MLYFGITLSTVMAAETPLVIRPAGQFEQLYGQLLAKYWRPAVEIHGIKTTVFDYAQMKRDAEMPDALFSRVIAALEKVDPTQLPDANSAKAFWINAYNIGAIRLVISNYPVDSLRSFKISLIKYPWSQDVLRINGRDYSLNEIEKDILLENYKDPLIIFAVSCAAISCPDRIPEPFTASRLDLQLASLIKTFFANTGKGVQLDKQNNVLTLSWILKKDQQLFSSQQEGVLGFVQSYLSQDQSTWLKTNAVEINYFDHDWTLNDLAQADH